MDEREEEREEERERGRDRASERERQGLKEKVRRERGIGRRGRCL